MQPVVCFIPLIQNIFGFSGKCKFNDLLCKLLIKSCNQSVTFLHLNIEIMSISKRNLLRKIYKYT